MNDNDLKITLKIAAYSIAVTFIFLFLVGTYGCAGVPLTHDQCNAATFPTTHEHELCLKAASDYEQAQYEKEDKRIIKR
ncbi:hypothetical protein LCGC14_2923830, partial [marine sediment metagenome]